MKKEDIVRKVRELQLPPNEYVVFGSCPLAAVGIREASDIDMLVSTRVLEQLRASGWRELFKGPGDTPLTYDVFEAHDNWLFSAYHPTLEQLQERAFFIDGVPFASLEDVRKWKDGSDNPKHVADIKLIDQYLTNHS